jgi:hypothetical protein
MKTVLTYLEFLKHMGRWTEGQTERYLKIVAIYIISDKNNATKMKE